MFDEGEKGEDNFVPFAKIIIYSLNFPSSHFHGVSPHLLICFRLITSVNLVAKSSFSQFFRFRRIFTFAKIATSDLNESLEKWKSFFSFSCTTLKGRRDIEAASGGKWYDRTYDRPMSNADNNLHKVNSRVTRISRL